MFCCHNYEIMNTFVCLFKLSGLAHLKKKINFSGGGGRKYNLFYLNLELAIKHITHILFQTFVIFNWRKSITFIKQLKHDLPVWIHSDDSFQRENFLF